MRTFEQISAWAKTLPALDGFEHFPGPDLVDFPGKHVIWTRYGGPGLDDTDITDDISWQARVVGKQNDYNSAENAADALDVAFLSLYSQRIEGVWVSRVRRVGGAPNPLLKDDAERTHFIGSYIVSTELALAN